MIVCIVETILNSPLILKAMADQINIEPIARNLITLYHNQNESSLRAFVIAQTKQKLEDTVVSSSPTIVWQWLLQQCGVGNVNGFTYTKITECDPCSVRNTFQKEYHVIRINLFDRSERVNMAGYLLEYESLGVSSIKSQASIECADCRQPLRNHITWNCLGVSLHLSFERIGPSAQHSRHRFATTEVTLPLVIAFTSKAFQLYAIIRMHRDGKGKIRYDAIIFDYSELEGVTKRAILIDENGMKTAHAEFDNLHEITSANVVLALYDDMIAKYKLWPKPMLDVKPDVQILERLTHISEKIHDELQPVDGEPIVKDEWDQRMVKIQKKNYIVHNVLPSVVTSKYYLPHHIPKYVGPNGTILIIRHFINNESAHDHVVHDCDWSADECHCDLIKTKIQPNPVYSQAIDRKEDNRAFYSALLHTLKSENVICAFANNEFHVSRFLRPPEPNFVDAYHNHPQIDWSYCNVGADSNAVNEQWKIVK